MTGPGLRRALFRVCQVRHVCVRAASAGVPSHPLPPCSWRRSASPARPELRPAQLPPREIRAKRCRRLPIPTGVHRPSPRRRPLPERPPRRRASGRLATATRRAPTARSAGATRPSRARIPSPATRKTPSTWAKAPVAGPPLREAPPTAPSSKDVPRSPAPKRPIRTRYGAATPSGVCATSTFRTRTSGRGSGRITRRSGTLTGSTRATRSV
jgi:hypothetical protein